LTFYAAELLVNDNFDITFSVINLVRYSRSRSFKVIEIGTNRKSVRDFLFVIHCNYVPIFYRLRDITIYWSKMHFLPFYTPQSRSKPPTGFPVI